MSNFLDLLFQIVVHPSFAMRQIIEEKSFKNSLIICAVSCALLILSTFETESGIIGCVIILVCIAANIAFHSAAIHYISSLWNGDGTAKNITKLFIANTVTYGFCVFPMFFMVWGFEIFAKILFILITVWSCILDVIAIRENYKFTTGKSVVILFIPQIIMFMTVVIFTALLTISAISGIMELQNIGTVINQI